MTVLAHSLNYVIGQAEMLGRRHAEDMTDTACIRKPQTLGYLRYRRYHHEAQ
jgi:hypothetical protein